MFSSWWAADAMKTWPEDEPSAPGTPDTVSPSFEDYTQESLAAYGIEHILSTGKHVGKSFMDAMAIDRDYVTFLKTTSGLSEPLCLFCNWGTAWMARELDVLTDSLIAKFRRRGIGMGLASASFARIVSDLVTNRPGALPHLDTLLDALAQELEGNQREQRRLLVAGLVDMHTLKNAAPPGAPAPAPVLHEPCDCCGSVDHDLSVCPLAAQLVAQAEPEPPPPAPPPRFPLSHFLTLGFYAVLGLEPGCTLPAIKKAYHQLCLTYHPDKGGETETFKFIALVYEVLSDRKKRQQYDQDGKSAFTTVNLVWTLRMPAGSCWSQ